VLNHLLEAGAISASADGRFNINPLGLRAVVTAALSGRSRRTRIKHASSATLEAKLRRLRMNDCCFATNENLDGANEIGFKKTS
jgi:hypothetical protein